MPYAVTKLYSIFKVSARHQAVNQTQLNFDIKNHFYQLLSIGLFKKPRIFSNFNDKFFSKENVKIDLFKLIFRAYLSHSYAKYQRKMGKWTRNFVNKRNIL